MDIYSKDINVIEIIKKLEDFGDAVSTQHFPKIKTKFPTSQKLFGKIIIPLGINKQGVDITIYLSYLGTLKGNNDVEIYIAVGNEIIEKSVKHVPIYPDIILNYVDELINRVNRIRILD